MGRGTGWELTPLSEGLVVAVRDQMQRQGMSQRGLAEAAGIPESTFSKRMALKQGFTLVDVEQMAPALGLSPHELILAAELHAPALRQNLTQDNVDLAARRSTSEGKRRSDYFDSLGEESQDWGQ